MRSLDALKTIHIRSLCVHTRIVLLFGFNRHISDQKSMAGVGFFGEHILYFINPCDGYIYGLGTLSTPIVVSGVTITNIFTPVINTPSALANIDEYVFIGSDDNHFRLTTIAGQTVTITFSRRGSPIYHSASSFGPLDPRQHRSYIYAENTQLAKVDGVYILPAAGNINISNNGETCNPTEIINTPNFIRFDAPIRFGLAPIQSQSISTTFNSLVRSFALCGSCGPSLTGPPLLGPPILTGPVLDTRDEKLEKKEKKGEKEAKNLGESVTYAVSALGFVIIFFVVLWIFMRD